MFDPSKQNCGTCKLWIKAIPTKDIEELKLEKQTPLMKCAGNNGCKITGPKFFCANWEKSKGKK